MTDQERLMAYLRTQHTTYAHTYDTDGMVLISALGHIGEGRTYPEATRDLIARLRRAGHPIPTKE